MTRHISILLAAITAMAITTRADINNPMTKAVLNVYAQQLSEDPKDYETYLNRANVYYSNNEYLRALSDADNALKYIPEKDTETRMRALTLRANIYLQTERPAEALRDLDATVALDPTSYVNVYLRANTRYTLEQYAAAREDYNRLLRLNPRSTEAMIGLARIAVKENNLGTATQYLDDAVASDPNNADIYVRRANVRRSMGNGSGAVEDIMLALSTDASNARATKLLVDMANTDYAVVIEGITRAIEQAPRVAMFIYLRAYIQQAHFHYKAALADYNTIITQNLNDYRGIYAGTARCRYALGQYEQALTDIDQALAAAPDNADNHILRARILRALGRRVDAYSAAARALALQPNNTQALIELGLTAYSQEQYSQAAELFGEATMTAEGADAARAYMLRASVLEERLNQPVAAAGFYRHVAETTTPQARKNTATDAASSATNPDAIAILNADPAMLRPLALLHCGERQAADAAMSTIIALPDADGAHAFEAACYYAQASALAKDKTTASADTDAAFRHLETALTRGYGDLHRLRDDTDAPANIAPLRTDSRFTALTTRFAHLF